MSYLLNSTFKALVLLNRLWCLTVPANGTPGNRGQTHLLSHVLQWSFLWENKNTCKEEDKNNT